MFEYKIVAGSSSGQDDEPTINFLGEEGWELVAVTLERGDRAGTGRRMYFLKRKKSST